VTLSANGWRVVFAPVLALAAGIGYLCARAPLLTLAAAGAAALLAFVVLQVQIVLLVLVAALPWEGLLQYPSATFSAVKLLGLLIVAAYVFRMLRSDDEIRFPPTLLPVLLLAVTIGLSFLASPEQSVGIAKVLRYVLFITFFFLVAQLASTVEAATRVLRVIVLSGAAAATWGIVAFVTGSLDRAGGPISDPNDFAFLMATLVPLCGYLFVQERRLRWLWGPAGVLLIASVFATLSRGALVGLAALFVWAVFTRRIPLTGVLLSIITVSSVLLLAFTFWSPLINDRIERKGKIADKNVASREAFWKAAVTMSADHPVLGVGPGRFGEESARYIRDNPIVLPNPVVHNSYLEILAENGIFALGFFLAFLAVTWRLLTRAMRRAKEEGDIERRRLATALQATMVVVLVSSFFLSAQVQIPFWLIGGLATAVAVTGEAATRRVAEPRPALA
jgi:putative inorganic carbon (hco3(-)) transporter